MRWQLYCGATGAALYFISLIVASLTWPGYSHVRQYVSELGSAAAPFPMLFNIGILLTGALALVGALGMARHFQVQGRAISGAIASFGLACWGLGMLFGAWFPMPDPLHNGFGVVFGVLLLPPALLVALRGQRSAGLTTFLWLWLTAIVALLLVMFGVGGLVTSQNVGLWQRGFAVALIPGIGVVCWILARRVGKPMAAREGNRPS